MYNTITEETTLLRAFLAVKRNKGCKVIDSFLCYGATLSESRMREIRTYGSMRGRRRKPPPTLFFYTHLSFDKPPLNFIKLMVMYALVNCDIYTGDAIEYDKAVVIAEGRIKALVPLSDLDASVERLDLEGRCVAPGFIDIQVNGGGGMLFNDSPTVDGIRVIAEAHKRFGTTNLLPTYITGPRAGMAGAVEAVNAARRDLSLKGVLGLHFEGPFINGTKAGVHDKRFVREANEDDLAIMLSPMDGVMLVTLAPELVSMDTIARLTNARVLVSLGHTNAVCAEAKAALSHGARCVTHVYNAMSALTAREPGMVGAALDDRESWMGIIVDGFHADFVSVRVAMRAKAGRKVILVTDAMPPVGSSEAGFRLGEYDIRVEGGRCVTSDDVLAGSALDMATAVRNCVQHVGVPKDEALRMASTYPAEFLGLQDDLGRIAPGYCANLAIFNNQIIVSAVVVDGQYQLVR